MTKEKSAVIYFDLKQKAALILSHNGSFQQSNKYQTVMQKHKDINFRMWPETCSMKDKFKFIPLKSYLDKQLILRLIT